jgi:tol-pal system protein YbgF
MRQVAVKLFALARKGRSLAAIVLSAGLFSAVLVGPGLTQGNDMASLQVRISQLEEQVRSYSGQIEGLQFQITQMQTLIERMQEDNEFRFNQLEGGDSGESEAVTTSGGETQSDRLPPEPDQGSIADEEMAYPDAEVVIGDEDVVGDDFYIGTEDDLYESQVFGDGSTQGPPPAPLGETLPSAPLDLSFDPSASQDGTSRSGAGDASAQYQAAYDAVVRGDYAFAEDQFGQFLEAHPNHNQAPDATYWLGETMIQRGAYDEAADVLLTGFETFPTSSRAPDLLLKLGVALHGTGEFDTACRTYQEVLRRYPDSSQAFRDRVTQEQARAGC